MIDETWDGLPVAREKPRVVAVVVCRRGDRGTIEYLLLHRAHHGPEYAGDWAWGTPAGARLPGESVEECARRELREEAGLELPLRPTDLGSDDIVVYEAKLEDDRAVALSPEHDAYRWLPLDEAMPLCLPSVVGDQLAAVAAALARRS